MFSFLLEMLPPHIFGQHGNGLADGFFPPVSLSTRMRIWQTSAMRAQRLLLRLVDRAIIR
jgi:hypothetical protein